LSASAGVPDERLRVRALEAIGALGDEVARTVIAHGSVTVEHDVSGWDGSTGHVRAHRVVVTVEPELFARFAESHAARDAVTAALSAAMSERRNEAVCDVWVVAGTPPRLPSSGGPYRDPW